MRNYDEQLYILNIDSIEFDSLVLADKIKLLNQKYRKLAILRHPDKNTQNKNATVEFQRLNHAYVTLMAQLNSQSDFQIPETHVEFNLNDLSFFQQDAIIELYNELLAKIRQADDDKEILILQNIEFLSLARKINNQSALFDTERAEAFRNYMEQANFYDLFIRNWRLFVIKTFGKELLDDFSYRSALGTGDFKNILDSQKLLNPFKLLISLFALIECVCFSLNHTFQRKIRELINSEIIFNIILLPCLTMGLFYYSPVLFIIFMQADIVFDWLEKIANPYNQIIKPLAKKLKLSEQLTACMTVALSVISVFSFTSFTLLLDILLNVTFFVELAKIAELYYNLYQLSTKGFVIACISLLITIFSDLYLQTNSYVEVNSNPIMLLISQFAVIALLSKLSHKIKHINEYQTDIMMNLPLPEEKTNTKFADIINSKHKTAYLSHCYFNTPENAKFKESEQEAPSLGAAQLLLT